MELCDLTAVEISSLVRERKASAVEVLESSLKRIAAVDGRPGSLDSEPGLEPDRVHAFISLNVERARLQAQAVDGRLSARENAGFLAGVPFTVKDIFCVQGTLSTAGSRILANFNSPYTATPVSRLEAAGGIMLGKVNLDEFAYGSSCESTAFQPAPRNPWDTQRVTGGSSGGSAAAVITGEGAFSLGSDTSGSIRQPAAFCGVVGVKPTYGRVSRYGLIAFGSSLDCPGPLARNIADAALVLQVIAGADAHDATAAIVPVPDYLAEIEKDIRGMRIGLCAEYFRMTVFDGESGELHEQPLPAEIESQVLRVAGRLAEMGADIVEDIPMPHTRYGIPAYFVISRVEASSNLHRYDGVKYGYRAPGEFNDLREMYRKSRGAAFGLQPKLRILMGMYVSAAQYSQQYYNRALRVRSLIRQDFDEVFAAHGKYRLQALLAPTTPTAAFLLGEMQEDTVQMQYADRLTVNANHAGIPALSFPAGFDAQGLPLGVQLMGPDFSEGALLRIAHAYEKATAGDAWRKRRPPLLPQA